MASSATSAPWRAYLVELAGTFAVVLVTSGAVLANEQMGPTGIGRVGVALAAGAVWAAALAFTVRTGGGFLNPAVAVTLWVFQRLDNRKALGLIGAQFLGGALAGLALRGLFFASDRVLAAARLGAPHLHLDAFEMTEIDRTAMLLGIGIEAVTTFILVMAVFALLFDPRFRQKAGEPAWRVAYLWLGLLVTAISLVTANVTGAAMNPARWLGTIIWEPTVTGLGTPGPFADHGPYWIGPTLGSLLAGMLYTYAIMPADAPKSPTHGMP